MNQKSDFKPTKRQRAELYSIAIEMAKQGIPVDWTMSAVSAAERQQEAYEMMRMWWEHQDAWHLKEDVLTVLQRVIDEQAK